MPIIQVKFANDHRTLVCKLWNSYWRSQITRNPGENKYGKFNVNSKSPLINVQNSKNGPHIIPVSESKMVLSHSSWVRMILRCFEREDNQVHMTFFCFSSFFFFLGTFYFSSGNIPLHHISPKLLRPLDLPAKNESINSEKEDHQATEKGLPNRRSITYAGYGCQIYCSSNVG